MRLRLARALLALALLATLLPGAQALAAPAPQAADPAAKARLLLARMTPAERLGQLFLVGFKGRDVTSKNLKILDLVNNYHIGGVILRAANDNFTGPQGTPEETFRIATELQTSRYNASQKPIRNPVTGLSYTPQYAPLFIALSQEGDLYPTDQMWNGLTALPSAMAIGATWNTATAERVGHVMGLELKTIGINLLLGPSLDILETPHPESSEDPGARTFGGDPFWVSQMGSAYIRGLHSGSSGQLAVIAKHFPGRGNADRSGEDEIPAIQKSADQLTAVELLPFMAAADLAESAAAQADGFLVPHVRYAGFQGTLRSTTRPLSLDASALDQILALPGLVNWRKQGGILLSENLGGSGLRRFYDPTGQAFDARLLARDAILGGNDLIYVDTNFISSADVDSYTTLARTLEFLAQKYREDQAFAARVDASVTRLLTLKYTLYPEFSLPSVLPSEPKLTDLGKSSQVAFDTASQGVTLVSPRAADLRSILPRPPAVGERIVFITDVISSRQCSQCEDQASLPVDGLQNAVIRLYGPRAGGQINAANLTSYSSLDLKNLLDNSKDRLPQMEDDLRLANWIVLGVQKVNAARPESLALRQLLAQRQDLIRNKQVVVFAFNAPYYLDATDIARVSAFYALYSKTPSFVEVAVRVLFQELTPGGASPVSVPGAGYLLREALAPDPAQIIPLEIDLAQVSSTPQATVPKTSVTPSATQTMIPTIRLGETITLRTGVIVDKNRHPVPDGTPVQFLFTSSASGGDLVQQVSAETVDGAASTVYRIQTTGNLEIRVVSAPALLSRELRLNITSSGEVMITAVTPTSQPTVTPTPTATLSPTPTATPMPSPTPQPVPNPGSLQWISAVLLIGAAVIAALYLGRSTGSLRWGVRWALTTAIGGLSAYSYLSSGMPGAEDFLKRFGNAGITWLTVLGVLLGWLAGYTWRRWLRSRARQEPVNGKKHR